MSNDGKIGIAFVIDTLATSGAGTEQQLLMLIANLDREHFAPHLICLRNSDWLQSARLSCPVKILDVGSLKGWSMVRGLRTFRAYCRQNRISLVQTYFTEGNLLGTVAAWLSPVARLISSRRNLGAGYWHTDRWLSALRLLQRVTDLYIANSQTVADYTMYSECVPRHKLKVIYNGVYLDRFEAITPGMRQETRTALEANEDDVVIGITANLRAVKRVPWFVETAGKLHRNYPATRFVIIGEGPDRPEIEHLIDEYGLADKTILTGAVADVVPYLAAMDIAVLCSSAESFSNSIVEYMAAGLPSVVSKVGGNTEAIAEDRGLAFDTDDADEFLKHLETLTADAETRKRMGMAARDFAFANYGSRRMTEEYEAVYLELLGDECRQ